MKNTIVCAFALILLGAMHARAAAVSPEAPVVAPMELQRMSDLRERLCWVPELNCEYVTALFADPRLALYQPPPPVPETPAVKPPKELERNPYFTKRFGLLTPESLERCRSFIGAHAAALNSAESTFGVAKEVICGHLRLETNFGIPTRLSPNPFGKRAAVNQLISLYVRNPSKRVNEEKQSRRREFAFGELKKLIASARELQWDLFSIPGSSTGAIGLVQFEPSSFRVAVDGNGDGRIDLFDPDDAILSIAHYLVTRGWNKDPEHQKRAIYSYYGGHYDQDPRKYYMKAVLKYANEMKSYMKEHPIESASADASASL